MAELEEFAEALFDQLSVEFNEEKEIEDLTNKINEDKNFKFEFHQFEPTCRKLFDELSDRVFDFTGIKVDPQVKLEFPNLLDFKLLKGKKVFTEPESRGFVDDLFYYVSKKDSKKLIEHFEGKISKFLVYSTYAKAYLSKISTTYGDFYDSKIYLNKFILESYPKIILYKSGIPYEKNFDGINSGYLGALKMTILEELVHANQKNLYEVNQKAVEKVNKINEELAEIILHLDDKTVNFLTEYLRLENTPDEFPIAKRANLFFTLNPDNFIVNVLGPEVMTFTKVEIDPKISEMLPQLLGIYQTWLKPIQVHHAAFTTMEGMAEFIVQNILKEDVDFQNYLTSFVGTDFSSYQIRKSLGKDFTNEIYLKKGKKTFELLIENPPTTRELKEPASYLNRL